jgi:UDP-N-acetyl-D-mannosaminuronic acid transferase (WecB/TagA/CpsF family)
LTTFDTAQAMPAATCAFHARWPYALHRTWEHWAVATRVSTLALALRP